MRNIYDNSEFFAAYAEMGRSKDGLKAAGEWHQLQPLFPKLQGKKVLDLGCGYGWHCKYAAQMGATEILGIDSSQKMIAKAVADNSDDKIKYKVCGVEEYIYPENTYDLVVSNLVLHYIENLANVYQKVYCTLKVGGYFLFNIEHPTFTAGVNEDWIYDENGKPKYWPIDNYYYTGERETNFLGQRVIKQHHTLTQILNPLIKCGFQIEAIEEAMPPADMMGMPGMCNEMRRPMMLLVKVKRFNKQLPVCRNLNIRVWGRHAIQTSNFPRQGCKILASIAVAPQGLLGYTVDLYLVLYFPVQPSQRRHPYELSVSICAHSGVLFSGRDLPRSAPAPHPGQHLRPAAALGRAPLRHREARAGQGSGPVPHRHLPAAVRACRRGRHGAVG